MQCRLFDPKNDKELVVDFWTSQKLWKDQTYSRDLAELLIDKYIQHSKEHPLYLVFSDDKIVMTLGGKKWNSVPYYSIIDFHAHLRNSITQFKKAAELAWTQLIETMQSEGRHSFYWAIREYDLATEEIYKNKIQLQRFIPILNNYNFNIECIIEKGKKTSYSLYNTFLIGYENEDFNIVIKRATLKPELFKNHIKNN